MKAKEYNIKKRIEQYVEQEKELLEKLQLKKVIVITFPFHTKVPLLGKLALKLLKMTGSKVDISFIDNKKKK